MTTTTVAAQTDRLLELARDVLSGEVRLPPAGATRVAALLARSALEVAVDERLSLGRRRVTTYNNRAKLVCLRALEGDLGDRAEWVWGALSEACHQHAYHLAPSRGEVAHLVRIVTEVTGDLAGCSSG